jgi:hypothetical protein
MTSAFSRNELDRDLGVTVRAALGPSILDCDGATLDPTKFAQPLHKRADALAIEQRRARAQVADSRQLGRLLRASRERPRSRCAAERG